MSAKAAAKEDTRVVTAHLPVAMAEKMDKYAQQMERSRGWIVKQAVANWLAWEEEKHRMTLEALAEVDAGLFIEDEDMAAWIESLDTDNPLPPPQPRR
ncbi:MAG TPA: ribbon-helix-helix domain-containing protein [Devosia sp.]|nr:ribbon-helix-helix domain-containing protein [Devosia sp.]